MPAPFRAARCRCLDLPGYSSSSLRMAIPHAPHAGIPSEVTWPSACVDPSHSNMVGTPASDVPPPEWYRLAATSRPTTAAPMYVNAVRISRSSIRAARAADSPAGEECETQHDAAEDQWYQGILEPVAAWIGGAAPTREKSDPDAVPLVHSAGEEGPGRHAEEDDGQADGGGRGREIGTRHTGMARVVDDG